MAGSRAGIGWRLLEIDGLDALQERPAQRLAGVKGTCTTNGKPPGSCLGGDGQSGSGPGLRGQVTTATPFAPRWSGPGWPSGPPVDDERDLQSRASTVRRPHGATLSGGICIDAMVCLARFFVPRARRSRLEEGLTRDCPASGPRRSPDHSKPGRWSAAASGVDGCLCGATVVTQASRMCVRLVVRCHSAVTAAEPG
jgi:hypothetical protein